MPITFLDEPRTVDIDASVPPTNYVGPTPLTAVFWSGQDVHGFSTPTRIGGVVTQPADVVLGLPGFEDAFEGVSDVVGGDVPYVFFDVEKLLRMLLHDSLLAFEIMASPLRITPPGSSEIPMRKLLKAGVRRGVLAHYRDVARGLLEETDARGPTVEILRDCFRNLLTARALSDSGLVSLHLPRLVEALALPGVEEVLDDEPDLGRLTERAEHLLSSIDPEDTSALDEGPADYEFLNTWLVEHRLANRR